MASLLERLQLSGEPAFRDLVRMGLVAVAADVADDPPDSDHPEKTRLRREWARRILPPTRPEELRVQVEQIASVLVNRVEFSTPPKDEEVLGGLYDLVDTLAGVVQEDRA
jgi:hypothetical protein